MQAVHYKTDGTAQACPMCFTHTCKKHPLQDHGKRQKALESQGSRNAELLKKLYEKHVGTEIDKMDKFAKDVKGHKKYAKMVEKERAKAAKRKRKKLTAAQQEAANSGLAMHVVMAMGAHDSDDEGLPGPTYGGDSDEDRKKKKLKKKDKKREKKEKKKEKKRRKKEKKKEKKKKESKSSSSSSSHDSSDSD